jgi:hypothetical protein
MGDQQQGLPDVAGTEDPQDAGRPLRLAVLLRAGRPRREQPPGSREQQQAVGSPKSQRRCTLRRPA